MVRTEKFIISHKGNRIVLVKLVEIYENRKFSDRNFLLREVFINPEQVVYIREEEGYKTLLKEGLLPDGLANFQEFSRICMNQGQAHGSDIIVIGEVSSVEKKLRVKQKQILKG